MPLEHVCKVCERRFGEHTLWDLRMCRRQDIERQKEAQEKKNLDAERQEYMRLLQGSLVPFEV